MLYTNFNRLGRCAVRKDITIKGDGVYVEDTVVIGDNVTIYENNRIEGDTHIADNVIIYPNNYIVDSTIGEGATIRYSVIEGARVGKGCDIGPFARLRPKADVRDGAKIGNFVEVKNAVVGENTKASHLTYVGDADIGKGCNIGCGVIFVNYNGRQKNRTTVGNNVFIGSNSNVIAPVEIGSDSYITAGSTITDKVESGDFVIGRVRQINKKGRAYAYLKEQK